MDESRSRLLQNSESKGGQYSAEDISAMITRRRLFLHVVMNVYGLSNHNGAKAPLQPTNSSGMGPEIILGRTGYIKHVQSTRGFAYF